MAGTFSTIFNPASNADGESASPVRNVGEEPPPVDDGAPDDGDGPPPEIAGADSGDFAG